MLLNICWQITYLFLAREPLRFRPLMLPAFLAKASAPLALAWFTLAGRIYSQWLTTAILDGGFAVLFLISFGLTGRETVVEKAERMPYEPRSDLPTPG